jgi:hypothetical protein
VAGYSSGEVELWLDGHLEFEPRVAWFRPKGCMICLVYVKLVCVVCCLFVVVNLVLYLSFIKCST